MNGKRAKQLRAQSGLTIKNRRELREFARQVESIHSARDQRALERRQGRRTLSAFFGLLFAAVALACLIAGTCK